MRPILADGLPLTRKPAAETERLRNNTIRLDYSSSSPDSLDARRRPLTCLPEIRPVIARKCEGLVWVTRPVASSPAGIKAERAADRLHSAAGRRWHKRRASLPQGRNLGQTCEGWRSKHGGWKPFRDEAPTAPSGRGRPPEAACCQPRPPAGRCLPGCHQAKAPLAERARARVGYLQSGSGSSERPAFEALPAHRSGQRSDAPFETGLFRQAKPTVLRQIGPALG